MIRSRTTMILSMIGVMLVFAIPVMALPETTVNLTIAPGDYDGSVLPALDSDTVDVKVDSDIPVDIYIMNNEEIYNIESGDFEYEKKWEGRTSLNVDYKVEDQDKIYYILIENPSETETANVDLEYKIYEEIAGEIIEDAAKDACCGGSMIFITVALITLVLIAAYIRSRRDQ